MWHSKTARAGLDLLSTQCNNNVIHRHMKQGHCMQQEAGGMPANQGCGRCSVCAYKHRPYGPLLVDSTALPDKQRPNFVNVVYRARRSGGGGSCSLCMWNCADMPLAERFDTPLVGALVHKQRLSGPHQLTTRQSLLIVFFFCLVE